MDAVSAGVVCERMHAECQNKLANKTTCLHVLVRVYTPATLSLSLSLSLSLARSLSLWWLCAFSDRVDLMGNPLEDSILLCEEMFKVSPCPLCLLTRCVILRIVGTESERVSKLQYTCTNAKKINAYVYSSKLNVLSQTDAGGVPVVCLAFFFIFLNRRCCA